MSYKSYLLIVFARLLQQNESSKCAIWLLLAHRVGVEAMLGWLVMTTTHSERTSVSSEAKDGASRKSKVIARIGTYRRG